MKQYLVLCLCLLGAAYMLYSCKHKSNVAPIGTTNNAGNNNPTSDTGICFERDILPIFKSSCAQTGCHDAISRQDGYQFTDYNAIVSKKFVAGNANATELYETITEDKPDKIMPPPPNKPLSNEQISLIRRWIDEGAKNSMNCPTKCDTNTFTYSGAVQPILVKNCIGCHSGSGASGGIVLDNYADVRAVTSSGDLLGAIRHEFGYRAMPDASNKLKDCEIRQIEKWLEHGMLNN